jgi:hypothetical protein
MSETTFDPSELDHDPITMQPFIPGAGTHVPPPGADWTEHTAGLDCLAHMDAAERGDVPFPGRITTPEWRRRREEAAKPYGDWWRRRHHCSHGVVLGATHDGDDLPP